MKQQQLIKKSLLVFYDPVLPLKLHCDASSQLIEAVLQHVLPNIQRRSIAVMSRRGSKGEQIYSKIDKEDLNLVEGVNKFHQ